jgi:hypothetical protein
MKTKAVGVLFGSAMMVGMVLSDALAQTVETSYKGDPDAYKLIFFRMTITV